MARPSKGITRDDVITTALQIADDQGLEAVSMRSVAAKLSVTPMALYARVSGKDDLLDGLVEALMADIHLPADDLPWDERLRRLASAARATGKRHPEALVLLLQRPVVAPSGHKFTEALFATLRQAGLDDQQVLQFEQLFSTWLVGFGASEVSGRFGDASVPIERRLAALPPDEFPQHHRLADALRRRNWDDEFTRSLEALITAIRNAVADLA
jgi:AcrR family transcriptional regulator